MSTFTKLATSLAFLSLAACGAHQSQETRPLPKPMIPTAVAIVDSFTVPAELTLVSANAVAAATRCVCGDGWRPQLSPCTNAQCSSICTHSNHGAGFCQ